MSMNDDAIKLIGQIYVNMRFINALGQLHKLEELIIGQKLLCEINYENE